MPVVHHMTRAAKSRLVETPLKTLFLDPRSHHQLPQFQSQSISELATNDAERSLISIIPGRRNSLKQAEGCGLGSYKIDHRQTPPIPKLLILKD